MFRTVLKNLGIFRKLCGDEALKNVVIGTTKWDEIILERGQQREQDFRSTCCEMLQRGSVIMRVDADPSVWEIINHILKNDRIEFVRIQEELLELQKDIPETDAGRPSTGPYTLEELRKQLLAEERVANMGDGQLRQKELEEIQKRMRETVDDIRKLKVPLSEKVKRFFG